MMVLRLIATIYILLSILPLYAQQLYSFDVKYPVHDLDRYLQVHVDTTLELKLTQVMKDTSLPWRSALEMGDIDSNGIQQVHPVLWGRITLQSNQDINDWLLQFEENAYTINGWMRGNGKVDVYGFVEEDQVFHKRSGVDYPSKIKDVKEGWNRNRVKVSLKKDQYLDLIIRAEGNRFLFKPFFDLRLRQPSFQDYFPPYDPRHFVVKVSLGMIIISLFYYLLSFFYLRKRVYMFFSIWLGITLLTMLMASREGLITEYIIGNLPGLRFPLWIIGANCVWFSFWLFGREYVHTKEKYPLLDRAIIGLVCFLVVELVIFGVLYAAGVNGITIYATGPHYMILSIATLFGLVISVLLFLKEDNLAKYFGAGAFVANLAPMVGGLWTQGLIKLPFDPFTWGIMFQIIAYSFGLVYRRQQEDLAFKHAQAELLEAETQKIEMQRIKDLDEVKTRFFANISHEFRTPLSLILGPIKQLNKANDGTYSISKKSYDIIHRNASRLQHLVDQLLDLSKLESGKVGLKLVRGDIYQFMKPLVSSFESMAQSKGIHYQVHFGSPSEKVYYDEDKLQKILNNLISNAFKYTPTGGAVSVAIEVESDHLQLVVKDTGKGMDKDAIDRIFDRFYRVEGTEEKGSGIGLALTKELIQLHNGHINVESFKGVGTTFKVSLPVSFDKLPSFEVIQEESIDQLEEEIIPKTDTIIGNDTKIESNCPLVLVVEDNPDLRSFITDQLVNDYRIIIAENGLKGEKMAINHIPDIIISDVMMPGMDGYTLCRTLKENQVTSHIPIILLTAKAGQKNKIEGLDKGADAYITKPFEVEELLLRMRNFISGREALWKKIKESGMVPFSDMDLSSLDDQFMQKVYHVIQDNLSNEGFTVEDLASNVGFSRSQLHRKLKSLIDKSANQLIREIRLNHAHLMLKNKTATVSEVAYEVGFSNLSYFSKSFKDHFGQLPSEVN